MRIVSLDQKEEWNAVIKSFNNWDIYYLNEYAHSYFIHRDGKPLLIELSHSGSRMAYVVMQNDISEFPPFQGILGKDTLFDWTTPYGYGGPLYEGNIDESWMNRAGREIEDYAKKNHIVSEFLRYHPLLQNQKKMESISNVIYLKKTVYVDTSSLERIQANMTPNARNMARKAEKNHIKIITDCGENYEKFMDVYHKTMQERHADVYYYFERAYYEYIIKKMKDHIVFFYAVYDDQVISASIFFYNDKFMHYHLSGTLPKYRKLAAANLILTKAAYWACEHGIRQFHLGGGVDVDDSLLRFKKHFNRNGLLDYCIGSRVFLPDEYQRLVNLRKETDKNFDAQKKYLIQYRG